MQKPMTPMPLLDPSRHPEVILALFVSAVVAMLVVPLPTFLIDALLAVNISAGLVILLVALLARRALDVSTFPSFLLVSTLFRLALNVSTTRKILATGDAGAVVRAFGRFVIQGDLVVGLVVFLVITLVQFLVIAKGSERVAEVAARFTLDAMPGKQMSIDAALRAGALTEEEAQAKRDELSRESQLFGAMDGAMKFVKGDAIAGLVITAVNLIGGLAIGVLRHGMTVAAAAETYSILTIGDALVAQIPALLITLGSGILVTRVEAEDKSHDLGAAFKHELFSNPKALGIASLLATGLACVPGLPGIPFLAIAAALGLGGRFGRLAVLPRLRGRAASRAAEGDLAEARSDLEERITLAKAQRSFADNTAPTVLPITIDLGPELSTALGFGERRDQDTELLGALIPQLRDALFLETGVRFPSVRVQCDVPGLPKDGFVVRVRDVPAVQASISTSEHLAIEKPERLLRLGVTGRRAKHPIHGGTVALIPEEAREVAVAAGITVWSPAGVVALHLAKVLRRRAKTFLGLQEVGELVERLEKAFPTLVRETVPKVISLAQLLDVLRRLVEEGVSIRDLKTILEALAEHGADEVDGISLTEAARAALSAQIAHAHAGTEGTLSVLLLDPVIEDTIRGAIQPIRGGSVLTLEPELCASVVRSIVRALAPVVASGVRPVVLTHATVRRYVRKLIEIDLEQVAVLSFDELPADLSVQPVGRATLRDLELAA